MKNVVCGVVTAGGDRMRYAQTVLECIWTCIPGVCQKAIFKRFPAKWEIENSSKKVYFFR